VSRRKFPRRYVSQLIISEHVKMLERCYQYVDKDARFKGLFAALESADRGVCLTPKE